MGWDVIFSKDGRIFNKPHPFLERFISLLKDDGASKVLDVGCGTGRHLVALAKDGFAVFGMDNSPAGLQQAKDWLEEEGLHAELKKADCYGCFPYEDDSFDALLSVQVIHHARIDDIKRCVSEMKRVLRPGGLLFVTVSKNRIKGRATKAEMIEPDTYVMLDGPEKGVPHHIFSKESFKGLFEGFGLLDLFEDESGHYCLLARLR